MNSSNEFLRERVRGKVIAIIGDPEMVFEDQVDALCDYTLKEMKISYRCGVQRAQKKASYKQSRNAGNEVSVVEAD